MPIPSLNLQHYNPMDYDDSDSYYDRGLNPGILNLIQGFSTMMRNRNRPQYPQQEQQQYQPNFDYMQGGLSRNPQQGQMPQRQADPNARFGTGSSYMDLIRNSESSGNYGARNQYGYSGAYQFGAPALEDVDYLKKGASRLGNKAMHDDRNWNIPGGYKAFMASKELQDKAMQKFSDMNENKLRKAGLISKDAPRSHINGLLAVAHLLGVGGVKAFLAGKNKTDANGTSAQKYYQLGSRAR